MEIIFMLTMLCLLVGPFAIFGLWYWFFTMLTIAVIVGLAELVATLITGNTLSQRFWKWSKQNKTKAWIAIGSLFIGWIMLLIHLAWKMIVE